MESIPLSPIVWRPSPDGTPISPVTGQPQTCKIEIHPEGLPFHHISAPGLTTSIEEETRYEAEGDFTFPAVTCYAMLGLCVGIFAIPDGSIPVNFDILSIRLTVGAVLLSALGAFMSLVMIFCFKHRDWIKRRSHKKPDAFAIRSIGVHLIFAFTMLASACLLVAAGRVTWLNA